jgi:hypothetical protein
VLAKECLKFKDKVKERLKVKECLNVKWHLGFREVVFGLDKEVLLHSPNQSILSQLVP